MYQYNREGSTAQVTGLQIPHGVERACGLPQGALQ